MSSDSLWSFSIINGFYDEDSSDEEQSHQPKFPAKLEGQLTNDLDIACRKDKANYKPNPFSIAKINAAARSQLPLSNLAAGEYTDPASLPAPSNKPPVRTQMDIRDAFRKQAQRSRTDLVKPLRFTSHNSSQTVSASNTAAGTRSTQSTGSALSPTGVSPTRWITIDHAESPAFSSSSPSTHILDPITIDVDDGDDIASCANAQPLICSSPTSVRFPTHNLSPPRRQSCQPRGVNTPLAMESDLDLGNHATFLPNAQFPKYSSQRPVAFPSPQFSSPVSQFCQPCGVNTPSAPESDLNPGNGMTFHANAHLQKHSSQRPTALATHLFSPPASQLAQTRRISTPVVMGSRPPAGREAPKRLTLQPDFMTQAESNLGRRQRLSSPISGLSPGSSKLRNLTPGFRHVGLSPVAHGSSSAPYGGHDSNPARFLAPVAVTASDPLDPVRDDFHFASDDTLVASPKHSSPLAPRLYGAKLVENGARSSNQNNRGDPDEEWSTLPQKKVKASTRAPKERRSGFNSIPHLSASAIAAGKSVASSKRRVWFLPPPPNNVQDRSKQPEMAAGHDSVQETSRQVTDPRKLTLLR